MTYRHLIFDFDGTLADSFPWFLEVSDEVADRFELERLRPEEIDDLRRRNVREMLSSTRIPLWKVPFITLHLKKLMERDIAKIRLFPGVPEMLHALAARGVRLTLASSNARRNVEKVLGPEQAALFSRFECGVALFGKAAKYRKLLKQSGFEARETLCIGDELRDLDAAREAGLPFGAVSWGCTHGEALAGQHPEHYFEEVADITELVCPAVSSPL